MINIKGQRAIEWGQFIEIENMSDLPQYYKPTIFSKHFNYSNYYSEEEDDDIYTFYTTNQRYLDRESMSEKTASNNFVTISSIIIVISIIIYLTRVII